jgi:hypothetical protein
MVREPVGRRALPGISLLELLIVFLIVGVLAGLLLPGVHHAWTTYELTECRANLNAIYKAFHSSTSPLPPPTGWTWTVHAAGATEMLICPADTLEVLEEDYRLIPEEGMDGRYMAGPASGNVWREGGDKLENVRKTTGGVEMIGRPTSAAFDDLESSSRISMFAEKEDFELPFDVPVDIGSPGYYDRNYDSTATVIPAGQPVNVYFLHFDSPGRSRATSSGSVSFREEILGIVCMGHTLDATDMLGSCKYSTTQDVGQARGYENGAERVELSADRHTFTIHRYHVTFPGEDCRILTKVPEEFVSYGIHAHEITVVDGPQPPSGMVMLVSDMASYAMNSQVKAVGSPPRQIMLLEFERDTVAESRGREFRSCFEERAWDDDDEQPHVAARHAGLVNILTVEGSVRSVRPEEIHPDKRRDLWNP